MASRVEKRKQYSLRQEWKISHRCIRVHMLGFKRDVVLYSRERNFSVKACDRLARAGQLFESYLHNRKQAVANKFYRSRLRKIEIAVPQGSVLGPFFPTMY